MSGDTVGVAEAWTLLVQWPPQRRSRWCRHDGGASGVDVMVAVGEAVGVEMLGDAVGAPVGRT